MRTNFPLRPLAFFLTVLLSASCTLGPEPRRPETVAHGAERYVHADEPTGAADDDASAIDPWWRSFGDPATAELVETALEQNPDLHAAAARVLEARAALGGARSTLWPEVTAGAGASRTKNSFTLPQLGRVNVYATTYSTNLDVAYQVDLFGRLKRTRQAAWADLLAEDAARRTVIHGLVAEVVRTRARIATLERGLDLARQIHRSWRSTTGSIERRYELGLVPAVELRLARENLAAAEASVVVAERALSQARLALDVLLGRRPGTGEPLPRTAALLPDLEPVPLGLPAELLDRRPDLLEAEMRLAAATARVGVALADLYPNLSLSAGTGTQADALDDVLSSEAVVFDAMMSLLAPIFDGGRRRAAVNASRARVEQLAARYSGAVLRALREVEDALVRDAAIRRRLGLLETRAHEARAADRIARDRYERGVGTFLQVLETERRLRTAEQALADARGEAWEVRVDLHLALGGDWGGDRIEEDRDTSRNETSTR